MKKANYLLKSLLLLVALIIGTAVQADVRKNIYFSQDYESAAVTDWLPSKATCTLIQSGGNTYARITSPDANGAAQLPISGLPDASELNYVSDKLTDQGYVVEFDMLIQSGNVSGVSQSQFIVSSAARFRNEGDKAYAGSTDPFSLSQKVRTADNYDTKWHVNNLRNTGPDMFLRTLAVDQWYHYTVTISSKEIRYEISGLGSGTTPLDEGASIKMVKHISTLVGQGGLLCFDNLQIYDWVEDTSGGEVIDESITPPILQYAEESSDGDYMEYTYIVANDNTTDMTLHVMSGLRKAAPALDDYQWETYAMEAGSAMACKWGAQAGDWCYIYAYFTYVDGAGTTHRSPMRQIAIGNVPDESSYGELDESITPPDLVLNETVENGNQTTYEHIMWNYNSMTLDLHYTLSFLKEQPNLWDEVWETRSGCEQGWGIGHFCKVDAGDWGYIYAYFTYVDGWGVTHRSDISRIAVGNAPEEVTALSAPELTSTDYSDFYYISFTTSQFIDEQEVNTTVYYKLDDDNYQVYTGGSLQVGFGTTLSYYATAEGYADSPVTTVTVQAPWWQTMTQIWSSSFGKTTGNVSLSADEPLEGYHYMLANDELLSDYVLTPNVSLGNDYRVNYTGLYSDIERTYAIAGLYKGQKVLVSIYDPTVDSGAYGARQSARQAPGTTRRVMPAGITPRVKAGQGLEIDTWFTYDNPNDAYKDYWLTVTQSGDVTFSVDGLMYISQICLQSERVADPPYFELLSVDGANRTYRIYNTSTTLHYTTAVANSMPVKNGAAWSTATSSYADVTLSGMGYLFAYVSNEKGETEVVAEYVAGVELTLNAPTIASKSLDNGVWTVKLTHDQSFIEGNPDAYIYYKVDEGAATLYDGAFTIMNGATLSMWTQATGYTNSPVVTATALSEPTMALSWSENYTYLYSSTSMALGTEVEPGLYTLRYNGYDLRQQHLLTPNENIGSGFNASYYNGIYSSYERTYAVSGLLAGQRLHVSYSGNGAKVTPLQGVALDVWNTTSSMANLVATADGTVKFSLSGGAYLREVQLYVEPEYGDVVLADANGNQLIYHYENATSPASFTGIESYAADESKAGRIIVASQVTDAKGNTHQVTSVSSLKNSSQLVSVMLPAQIESISSSAFSYCSQLTSINLSELPLLTAIPSYCFRSCGLQEITIGGNITSIGDYAFDGCNKLININIGPNVKTIGNYAFRYAYAVEHVNIDPAVSGLTIGHSAFRDNDSLRTITIPKGVTSLDEYCFAYCDSLRTTVFDEDITLTTLPANCFYNDVGLLSVSVPKSVSTLGDYCFSGCSSLRTMEFATDAPITAIPSSCFRNCTSLETITLPDAVETVGSYAFYGCEKLLEITFGPNLKTFYNNYNVFYSCSKVEKMTIPGINFPFQCNMRNLPSSMMLFVHPDMVNTYKSNSYTSRFHILPIGSQTDFAITTTAGGQVATMIPAEVAANVLSLKITGPINGTDVNQLHELMPFLQVLDLKQAQIVAGGEDYYRFDFNTSTNVATRISYTYYKTADNIVGQYMFYNMPNLKRLLLPDGATSIEQYGVAAADTYNTKLAYVEMPSSLTVIANYAFYQQQSLAEAAIPASVTSIGESAFRYAGITEAVIPDGVTTLANNTFADCQKLEKVVLSDQLTSIGNNAFSGCKNLSSPVVFPASLKTIGQYAFYNCNYLTSVTFSEGLTSIGNSAFCYCYRLKEAVLPASLTSLGSSAFAYADSLKTFTFPANIKQVPDYVLQGIDALASVTLAEGTKSVGYAAFADCPKLAEVNNLNQSTLTTLYNDAFRNTGFVSITLPESITSMGPSVFEDCKQLESANIPSAITRVPYYTFSDCVKLTSVTLHDGITQIDDNAFYNCKLLPTLQLSDQITSIGNQSFSNCENLELTSLPSALTNIGWNAFQYTKKLGESLTIPGTVTSLGDYAFYHSGIKSVTIAQPISSFGQRVFQYCEDLESVTLPKKMTVIPAYTFADTKNLKTIALPDSLKEIGDYAFEYSGLAEIYLPGKLQTIGREAFYSTQLEEITVPKNVTSVGDRFAANCSKLKTAKLGRKQDYSANSSFDYFYGCDNLELLRVYAGTPPATSSWSLNSYMGYRTNCVLEVPDGQVDIYQATDVWKDFKEIRAFQSEETLYYADFAALQKLYRQLDGTNWTKTWNVEENRHSNGKWQGVTTEVDDDDDELFYITSIDLTAFGLKGKLPKEVFTLSRLASLNLSHNAIEAKVDTLLSVENNVLTTLNLEGNQLRGDLAKLVKYLPGLTNLNVQYNQLTAYSEATPNTTLSPYNLQYGCQFIDWQTKEVSVPDDLYDQVVTNYTPGRPVAIESNTLQTYRHRYGDWDFDTNTLYRMFKSYSDVTSTWEGALEKSFQRWDASTYYEFKAPKGQLVAYTSTGSDVSYVTHILYVDWDNGDVNADLTVDVSDVQNVVYYALNDARPNASNTFNYSAADLNSDNVINVQDIVGTVGLVLSYDKPSTTRARIYNKAMAEGCSNRLFIDGNKLKLANSDAVAALQLTISGISSAEVPAALRSNFSVSTRRVDGGVRVLLYSPAGNILSSGQHELLINLPAGAAVTDARLVDEQAGYLSVDFSGETTAISTIDYSAIDSQTPVYDLSGRRVGQWNTLPKGVYIVNLHGKQYKVKK